MWDFWDIVLFDGVNSVQKSVNFSGSNSFNDVPSSGVTADNVGNAVDIIGEDKVILWINLQII